MENAKAMQSEERADSILPLIRELSRVTLSPQTYTDYFELPEIMENIDFVLNSNSRVMHYPELTDDEIKGMIGLILSLANTPYSLRGSLLIAPCIKYLLIEACKEADTGFGIMKKMIRIARDWFEALRQAPKAKKDYCRQPDIKESPLFRFHLDAYTYSKVNARTLPSLYKAYAYQLHKATRKKEENMFQTGYSETTFESYVRVARFFFKYLPEWIKSRNKHPEFITEEYIQEFSKGYAHEEKRLEDKELSETALNYESRLRDLIELKTVKPKSHDRQSSIDVSTMDPADGAVRILLEAEGEVKIAWERHNVKDGEDNDDPDAEQIDIAAYEAEHQVDLYNIDDDQAKEVTTARKPTIDRRYEDKLNLRNFHFWWDASYLNLFHYAIIYQAFYDLWKVSSYYKAIIAYLQLLIHSGRDERKLLDLKIAGDDIEIEPNTLLHKEGKHYLISPPLIDLKKPNADGNCLEVASLIKVPLPESIGNNLSRVIVHGNRYVFTYTNKKNEVKRLSLVDIERFLERHINGAYPEYQLKISVAKIVQSFLPLYAHRFGMDPIVCCYVSGEDPHRYYTSQLHYIRLDHAMLEQEYLSTHQRVAEAIKDNLLQCIINNYIDGDDQAAYRWLERNRVERDNSIKVSNHSNLPGYGSPIICKEEYIRMLVEALKDALQSSTEVINQHNLLAVYTYLCLQFATGLRPRNDPDILKEDYNSNAGLLAISDKQSAKYFEKRILPLPKVTKALLDRLISNSERLKLFRAQHYNPSALTEEISKLFFLADHESGEIKEFTLKEMRALINTTDVYYSLPMNMPRHYMRNYLYQKGIANDLADAWMGHQRNGRELFNIVSSADFNSAVMVCLPAIEEMLGSLGFDDMRKL